MASEKAPENFPSPYVLNDLVGEAKSHYLAQVMIGYTGDLLNENGYGFPETSERIETAGEKLAVALTTQPVDLRQRMVGFTRCLSFGLKLNQLAAGNEGDNAATAALEGVEQLLAFPAESVRDAIYPSYQRYLSRQIHLLLPLQHTLGQIAPAGYDIVGRNVISYAVELGDQYLYLQESVKSFDVDVRALFTPPDATETEDMQ